MTLSVYCYVWDQDAEEWVNVEWSNDRLGSHLAGFESTRQNLWGAEVMKSLGLTILPSLDGGNIQASGDELDQLENEILLIRGNLELVLENVPFDQQMIMQRTQNFLDAIAKAREVGGCVVIS
jgi:hypothetical protein